MIIGSQNINDRSLLGSRDSELGILVHRDSNLVKSTMNGKSLNVSKFVQDFRLRVWAEHLGIPKDKLQDYADVCSPKVYKDLFYLRAQENTKILNKAFPFMPQDSITTISKMKDIMAKGTAQKITPAVKQELDQVQGTLVLYPLCFFEESLESLPHLGRPASDKIFQ